MSEAVTHWNGHDTAQRSHASAKRVLVNILALDVSVGSFYLLDSLQPELQLHTDCTNLTQQ